jgi:hypothetical protein
MAVNIANVELTFNFDQWRVTTNEIINTLKNDVVLIDELPGLLGTDSDISGVVPAQSIFLDSVEVQATPIGSSPIDTVQLSDISKTQNFKPSQKVRIYNARPDAPYTAITTPAAPTTTKNGFPGSTNVNFSYRIAQFEFSSGKISASSSASGSVSANSVNFNETNNIALSITRTNQNYGILVYRSISGEINTGQFNLIAVLGPKDLQGLTSTWIDYYNYDYTTWSNKNSRNEFTSNSGLIHFPLTHSTAAKLGWVDAEIAFVDTITNRITFTENLHFGTTCIVSHNDTEVLQSLIDNRYSAGSKSLELSTKTYITAGLNVPDNFAIIGNGGKTTLRKLSWSSFSDYGNKMIRNLSGDDNLNLNDIIIDGNMQNQYLLNESIDIYSNYIVDCKGDNPKFIGVKIRNPIGGGINAFEAEQFTFVNSKVLDGGLSDRYDYSPLNLNSASEILVTSNLFRNFPSAVDASIVTTGSIVGNIIKNCGTGLFTYGSTNLVTSPNILMGPANEFLPTPDILNSVYDSANIKLEKDTNFNSDVYTYQENGELFDLTANRALITHRIDRLQKVDSIETLYGSEILIANTRPIQQTSGTDLANGEFRFSISAQNVNVLKETYSYSNLKLFNSNHVGIVYRSILTEYVPSGTIDSAVSPVINAISRSITANTIGVNSTADVLNITDASTYFSLGDEVYYNVPASNTAVGGLTSNTIYYVSFVNSTSVALSSTYNGANINLTELRTTNPGEIHALNKLIYTIRITNTTNISVGTKVRFLSHGGTPNLDNLIGTVISYNSTTGICEITFQPDINISSAGSGGAITVENSFVLAKGTIL